MRTLLAADIGATNCRFALFQEDKDTPGTPLLRLMQEQWLAGAAFSSFREALHSLCSHALGGNTPFLESTLTPDLAVIAPAGPVQGESCRISNLPWTIRSQDVREELGVSRVGLINDFSAQAYACLMPETLDVVDVLRGEALPGAPVAVVGAGTGFGHALIIRDAATDETLPQNGEKALRLHEMRRFRVLPSEAGHCDFPFMGGREQAFADFVRHSTGSKRIIGDTVVAGSGLAHIYAFLTGKRLPAHEVTARLDACPEAVEWFARFYGRGCRNYVLSTLALGGLYITGGMALRLPALTHPSFAEEFLRAEGPQKDLVERLPVRHIRNTQAGLWGAAVYGMLHL